MFNNINIDPSDTTTQATGAKQYELTNHLGNVLATITDKGVITSAQAYYPFGLTLASRSFTAGSSYRYSFNGKEDDKETGFQDYGMRLYFKRVGRFLSVDPIGRKYPELTPYQFASNRPIQGVVWANELNQVDITKTGINTPLRQAHFLAQICHETDGFRVVEEDMQHYTAQRITEIWPKRFADLESAKPYAHNAEKLANKVYSNRMGNGDEASGDGYNFRGRGAIQLTGRESYSKFTKWYQKEFGDITVDFEKNPSLIGLPKYSILSAVWEYTVEKKGLNKAADRDDIKAITQKINGGETGIVDRKDRLSRAKKALDTPKP